MLTNTILPIAALLVSLAGVGANVWINVRFKRKHDREMAALQEESDRKLERAKGDVARELKSHETNLRLAADLRMRLIEQELTSLAETRRSFRAVSAALHQLAIPCRADGHTGIRTIEALAAFYAALREAPGGIFTPREFHEEIEGFMRRSQDICDIMLNAARLPTVEARHAALVAVNPPSLESAALSRAFFHRWWHRIEQQQYTVLASVQGGVAAHSRAVAEQLEAADLEAAERDLITRG